LSTANSQLAAKARNVAGVQIISSVVVAGLFLMFGTWDAVSAFYGGFASVLTALYLSRGVKRAEEAVLRDPKRSLQILYFGAVQRFLLVAGLLALGLAVFKLAPIAMCVGFAVAQLSFVMGSRSAARG
jgi:F0F1-type ATP synthase assembly protein I